MRIRAVSGPEAVPFPIESSKNKGKKQLSLAATISSTWLRAATQVRARPIPDPERTTPHLVALSLDLRGVAGGFAALRPTPGPGPDPWHPCPCPRGRRWPRPRPYPPPAPPVFSVYRRQPSRDGADVCRRLWPRPGRHRGGTASSGSREHCCDFALARSAQCGRCPCRRRRPSISATKSHRIRVVLTAVSFSLSFVMDAPIRARTGASVSELRSN